jgi:glucosylglycerate synthase
MANVEAEEATNPGSDQAESADLIIGIPAAADPEEVRRRATKAVTELLARKPIRVLVAYPGNAPSDSQEVPESELEDTLQFLEYAAPQGSAPGVTWLGLANTYAVLLGIAQRFGAKACAVLGADLATLDGESIGLLTQPVLEQRAELVMPIYPPSKYESLLNSGILYPVTQALYGRRVKHPLAADFGASTSMMEQLVQVPRSGTDGAGEGVIWPATQAVVSEKQIAQAHVHARHAAQNDGLDLSTVLSHLVGSLYGDVERQAPLWQRLRGSQPVPILGSSGAPADDGQPVDIRPMLDSFQLASRNLQEVWSLILPPVTLLELKRISRIPAEQFRIPDAFWVRIIYDFALAYRLRTISRAHLLGALTPLYLGWVASYVLEVSSASTYAAEQRIEQLAKAFEDGKPYLLSRWRWPDRFNP